MIRITALFGLWLAFLPPVAQGFEPRSKPFAHPDPGTAPAAARQGQTAPAQGAPVPASTAGENLDGRSLRGMVLNGKHSYANVDGRLIRLGESLDGWRLIRLNTDSAIFLRRGQRQTLVLQRPRATQESPPATAQAPVAAISPGVLPEGAAGGPMMPAPSAAGGPAARPTIPAGLPQAILEKLIGAK